MLRTMLKSHLKTLILCSIVFMQPAAHTFASSENTTSLQYSSLVRVPQTILHTNPSYHKLIQDIKEAFYDPCSPEVILYMETCLGGEGIASHAIYQLIKNLKKATCKPVYVFIDHFCASGGYMIACAADEIVCHHDLTEVGSVGVVSMIVNVFQAQKTAGINSTIISSAPAKLDPSILDPQSEEFKLALKYRKDKLMIAAEEFVSLVLKARGAKLKVMKEEIAKAEMYQASHALKNGLIDNIMDGPTFIRKYCRAYFAAEKITKNMTTYRVVSPVFMNSKKELLERIKEKKNAKTEVVVTKAKKPAAK